MEDFLSRFSDSLIFEHTKNLFFFDDDDQQQQPNHENLNPISETLNPNPNPKPISSSSHPKFQTKYLSCIAGSLYSLTIGNIYPGYKALANNIVTHSNALETKNKELSAFLQQKPNRYEVDDVQRFIKRYRAYVTDLEKELDYLETQIEILEKKIELDLKLMTLVLMDTDRRAVLVSLLEEANKNKTELKALKKVLLAEKTIHEFWLLGLKGIIANDVVDDDAAALSSAPSSRILRRFNWGNSSITLRFRALSRGGK